MHILQGKDVSLITAGTSSLSSELCLTDSNASPNAAPALPRIRGVPSPPRLTKLSLARALFVQCSGRCGAYYIHRAPSVMLACGGGKSKHGSLDIKSLYIKEELSTKMEMAWAEPPLVKPGVL